MGNVLLAPPPWFEVGGGGLHLPWFLRHWVHAKREDILISCLFGRASLQGKHLQSAFGSLEKFFRPGHIIRVMGQ